MIWNNLFWHAFCKAHWVALCINDAVINTPWDRKHQHHDIMDVSGTSTYNWESSVGRTLLCAITRIFNILSVLWWHTARENDFNSAIRASLIDFEKQQLPDSEPFKDSVSYLWRSFVALEHRSVVWCQQSLQTPGGWGVRGSVSACPTRCGTTSGGRDTVRSHSPTNANAEKEKEIERWNGGRQKKTVRCLRVGAKWRNAEADTRGSGSSWHC